MITHAMTVDVEDYYHVSAFGDVVDPSRWESMPSRVEDNTRRLMDLFDEHGIKATFFVLGWVAERNAELIKEIARKGHEVASHGYSHQLVYNQSYVEFKTETARSKDILEDLVQAPIKGYRAASYSITRKSLWALDILTELGFEWDSSIFPIRHDRYGIVDSPATPYNIITANGLKITELPLTTAHIMGVRIPAAGGGYFRQYPYFLSKWLFLKAAQESGAPAIFYLHPWEVDPEQPRIEGARLLSRFRHYRNLDKCLPRLQQLIKDFKFSSIGETISSCEVELEFSF